ncbi:zinc finger protein 429 [Manduca sexta]|uniref:Uncharacterized protein n=1 Tax=Manduca sexta TaxID=7130 RepID=A0A921ZL48_MANSE|nr:zinc finger protein 429 [Manduca sexta]KAG6459159.1 hypothetical protein O3G_MSEX011229 [Manduca sexta]
MNLCNTETQISTKTKYGECRCCLAKGNHQDMTEEYYYNGIREVFVDIFTECFNLCLSTNSDLSVLICQSCVLRLRDASHFRMMVVRNEKQLLDALAHSDNKHTIFINVASTSIPLEFKSDIKIESVKEEPPETDKVITYELQNYECNYPVVSYDAETAVIEGEKALLSRYEKKNLKPLPTRRQLHTICPNYVKQLKYLKGMVVKPSAIEKLLINCENSTNQILSVPEKLGQIINTNTVLQFSNAIPFKSRSWVGFTCFYCPAVLDSLSLLRDHSIKHDKSELKKLLSTYPPFRLIVNVDVTDLKCSLCDQPMTNMETLKIHLIEVHEKEYHKEFTDRVVPFKSVNNYYECQVCGDNFETFCTVERHMNVHYKNYLCSECGMGFVTENRLKVHAYSTHAEGTYQCEQCNKVLQTKHKLKMHIAIRHNMLKRFKCPKCDERFTEYFPRQKHMAVAHGIDSVKFKCSECGKLFHRRYALSRHLKRNHLEEKDHHCTHCPYKCFTVSELRLHMIKHTGEKKFECTICNKALSRKKSLTEHMKIHNNDRRFVCAVCGQAFVQNCSLKGHMKTHHSNIEHKVN